MSLRDIVRRDTESLHIIGAYASLSGVCKGDYVKSISIHMAPVTVTYDLEPFNTPSGEYLDGLLEDQKHLAGILEKHKKKVYADIVEFQDKHQRQHRLIVLPKMIDEIVKLPLLPFRWALAKYVARNYKLQEKSYKSIEKIAHTATSHLTGLDIRGELRGKAWACAGVATRISTLSTELANLTSHIPLRIMAAFRSNYSHFMKQIRYAE